MCPCVYYFQKMAYKRFYICQPTISISCIITILRRRLQILIHFLKVTGCSYPRNCIASTLNLTIGQLHLKVQMRFRILLEISWPRHFCCFRLFAAKCPRGYEDSEFGNTCTQCRAGFYKANSWNTPCRACPINANYDPDLVGMTTSAMCYSM